MHSYTANVRNEIEKLFVQRKILLLLVLTGIVPVLAGFLLGSLNNGTGISFIGSGGAAGLPLLMLDALTVLWLPPVLFLVVAEMFAGEKASRTMKNVLTRPIARSAVYASKVTAVAVLCLTLLGETWLISLLMEFVMGLGSGSSALGAVQSLGIYLAAFVPMVALALIAVFVVQWFGSSTGAFLLLLFIYLGAKLQPFFFPAASTWNIFDQTDWYRLWLATAPPINQLVILFMFILAHGIMSYAAGLYRFEKQSF
ncbi:ABC-2 type transport system permease protein [Paenibacillus phyllosphaerae]|uniref:ABC-2 type transport system permease protein n=1 Tax=Paenibacillus phyllosphaerae TaxID=274593 RepID=A0A7W5FMD1_9BACL|nr:ABC transporter permease [Paenibacillus phyllosphaerae]MBB3110155.1 ABC-2 type transport system permease protein [Paenibacillus phyllosphaerae]